MRNPVGRWHRHLVLRVRTPEGMGEVYPHSVAQVQGILAIPAPDRGEVEMEYILIVLIGAVLYCSYRLEEKLEDVRMELRKIRG